MPNESDLPTANPAVSAPLNEPVIPVVGIGASAGGLEAIQAFVEALPADSGAAFVIIQHLSPDYKSMMVELLSRKTELPVNRAEDGMRVQPNQLYLIPPKKNLTLFHGHLILKDQPSHEGLNLPVDIFLQSLAEDLGVHSVGVVLSGTGSDGARGIRAIKEHGGLVMVQNEETAQFDGMPRAAIATGMADFILPPGDMPGQLIAYLKHPYAPQAAGAERLMGDESSLTRIFALLRAKTKVDFTYYKPSTILRRIERRISVTQQDDLASYAHYLEQNAGEAHTLYREMLIGVTCFFRDPEVMQQLSTFLKSDIIPANPARELRFWVAGCSTGEEAYTIAIIAREIMESLGINRDLKIFATDIDRDAILTAGSGIYNESICADLKPEFITKYFYRRGNQFHIARNIREMVVFAQHNLVKDPPFTQIDLVSCRNLLIYLQGNLQRKALEMFNFSLRPNGILMLGTSETIGDMEDCFEPLNRRLKIFRSKGRTPILGALDHIHNADGQQRPRVPLSNLRQSYGNRLRDRAHEQVLERLLDTMADCFCPLAVVVNEQLEIVHILGDSSKFFKIPSGRAVLNIAKMVDREMAIPLTTGIQKAFRTQQEMI